MIPEKLLESFWKKVKKTNSCWEWTAVKTSKGYGHLPYARNWGFTTLAHRLSYLIHRGDIPEGLLICHTCDNPHCVNPEHLFLGTQVDNMQDCLSKGRVRYITHRGESNGRCKISREQALEIKHSLLPRKELMKKFGISRSMVGKIKSGSSWKELQNE